MINICIFIIIDYRFVEIDKDLIGKFINSLFLVKQNDKKLSRSVFWGVVYLPCPKNA